MGGAAVPMSSCPEERSQATVWTKRGQPARQRRRGARLRRGSGVQRVCGLQRGPSAQTVTWNVRPPPCSLAATRPSRNAAVGTLLCANRTHAQTLMKEKTPHRLQYSNPNPRAKLASYTTSYKTTRTTVNAQVAQASCASHWLMNVHFYSCE